MKITCELLREKGGSCEQVERFAGEWPDGVEVTYANCLRAAELGLDLNWAVKHLLSAAQRKVYNKAAEAVLEVYNEAVEAAWEVYNEAVAPAREVYNEAVEAALEVYNEAIAPAREVYREAIAPAREVYNEAIEAADKVYNEALALAFFNASQFSGRDRAAGEF